MRNLLTKEAFREWCEKQPAEKRYNYDNPSECACGQFFAKKGIVAFYRGLGEWCAGGKIIPAGFDMDAAAVVKPHTFGALAARLREPLP